MAALACGCASTATKTAATKAPEPISLARMVGQLMLVRMEGRAPNASFLSRVRSGQIGGVVLFADNYGPSGPGR
jgi:hypothetical protein